MSVFASVRKVLVSMLHLSGGTSSSRRTCAAGGTKRWLGVANDSRHVATKQLRAQNTWTSQRQAKLISALLGWVLVHSPHHPTRADDTADEYHANGQLFNVSDGRRSSVSCQNAPSSEMSPSTCGSAISNVAAQRQPEQAQWWTAGRSHRSAPSYQRAESRRANMHRIATCDGLGVLYPQIKSQT